MLNVHEREGAGVIPPPCAKVMSVHGLAYVRYEAGPASSAKKY